MAKPITSKLMWRLVRRNPAVLNISPSGSLSEQSTSPFSRGYQFSGLNAMLHKAVKDPLVKGVRLQIGQLSCGLSKVKTISVSHFMSDKVKGGRYTELHQED